MKVLKNPRLEVSEGAILKKNLNFSQLLQASSFLLGMAVSASNLSAARLSRSIDDESLGVPASWVKRSLWDGSDFRVCWALQF